MERKLAPKDNCAVKVDCVGDSPWTGTPKDYYVNHGDDYSGGYTKFDKAGEFFLSAGKANACSVALVAPRLAGVLAMTGCPPSGAGMVTPSFRYVGMAAPTRRMGFLLAAWLPDGRLYIQLIGMARQPDFQAASNSPAASASK